MDTDSAGLSVTDSSLAIVPADTPLEIASADMSLASGNMAISTPRSGQYESASGGAIRKMDRVRDSGGNGFMVFAVSGHVCLAARRESVVVQLCGEHCCERPRALSSALADVCHSVD